MFLGLSRTLFLLRWRIYPTCLLCLLSLVFLSDATPVQLTSANIDEMLSAHELVFIDFYADWCHFSQMLKPIFEDAAKQIAEGIGKDGRVILAFVDCEHQNPICQKYGVNKYPTMKLFRYGDAIKKEYRAERSLSALTKFVEDQMKDSINQIAAESGPFTYEDKKKYIVGRFETTAPSTGLQTFKKLGSLMRDDCNFILYSRTNSSEFPEDAVYFHGIENQGELKYPHSNLSDYETLHTWARDMCISLVRELTFQNAEELTEEGLPFFILFYNPEDKESPKLFQEACQQGLQHQKYRATLLTADGVLFSHPLTHLGKSQKDLPVIAIDSFKHMFVYPKDVHEALKNPSMLDRFLEDLHSGKLHREFHYGPDPETPVPEIAGSNNQGGQQPKGGEENKQKPKDSTTPPKSIFQKLQPSSNRYSILRDEL